MPLIVNTTTPPAVEPLTLAEVHDHLRITWTNEDTYLTRLITAARKYCEVAAKRTFINTVYTLEDDAFPFTTGAFNKQVRQFYGQFQGGQGAVYPGVLALNAGVITFPRAPLVSVQSVTYFDTTGALQTMSPSLYIVQPGAPGRMMPIFGQIWPVTLPVINAVQIKFTAGYGPDETYVSEADKQAILLMLSHLYEHPSAVATGAPVAMPMAVEALLGIENNAGGYA